MQDLQLVQDLDLQLRKAIEAGTKRIAEIMQEGTILQGKILAYQEVLNTLPPSDQELEDESNTVEEA